MESILAITNDNSEVKIYTAHRHRTTTGMLDVQVLSGRNRSLNHFRKK